MSVVDCSSFILVRADAKERVPHFTNQTMLLFLIRRNVLHTSMQKMLQHFGMRDDLIQTSCFPISNYHMQMFVSFTEQQYHMINPHDKTLCPTEAISVHSSSACQCSQALLILLAVSLTVVCRRPPPPPPAVSQWIFSCDLFFPP